MLEISDQLPLKDFNRLLARVEFEALRARWRSEEQQKRAPSYLKYRWDEQIGNGYLINFFPNGEKLLIACGNNPSTKGESRPNGLFLGGGLPTSHYEEASLKQGSIGMAGYNGQYWLRLWGNSIETFSISPESPAFAAESWNFLGSKVLFASQNGIILRSSHRLNLAGTPIRIDRFLVYKSGDHNAALIIKITNEGGTPTGFLYRYTDDRGQVSNQREKILKRWDASGPVLEVKGLDSQIKPFLSLSLASGGISFIAWQKETPGDMIELFAQQKEIQPQGLVGLQWGSHYLQPGQHRQIMLLLGGTASAHLSGMNPAAPQVVIDREWIDFALGAPIQ